MKTSSPREAPSAVADPPLKFYQTAERCFGWSRSTAEKFAARGEIATFKIGRLVMARTSAFDAFVKAAEAKTIADRRAA